MNLSKYYEEICKEPILSKEEEIRLISIYKSPKSTEKEKQTARETLIKANLRFVFKQAKYFSKNDPIMFEELISAGNEGLIVGLDKFNPARKTRLLSYAGWWVNQRILKEMAKVRIVSLPIWKQQLATRIAKAKDHKENVTIEDLKLEFPEILEKDIRELSGTKYLTYYIDDIKEGRVEAELLIDFDREIENRDSHIDNRKIYFIVKGLTSPYKEILSMSFGLDDNKEYSNTQIARKLLLTKDQVKELKKEALELVKEELSTD